MSVDNYYEKDSSFQKKLESENFKKLLKQKNFSKNLKGDKTAILMTCPEIVIEHLAQKVSKYKSAVELCCGIGLTTIKIAEKIDRVIGIDIDESRIKFAEINAKKYGVDKKTSFIVGDVLDINLLKTLKADVVILDPEWSASKSHENINNKSLLELTNPNMKELFNKAKEIISDNIIMKVPNTFEFDTLNTLGKCEIDNIIWNDKIMLKYVYFSKNIIENKEVNYYFDI